MVIERQYKHKETGKNIIVAFNDFGYRCGYVEVGHENVIPIYTRLYHKTKQYEPDFIVFGGVTFRGLHSIIDKTVIGFDCAHYGSKPDIEKYKEYYGNSKLAEEIDSWVPDKGKIWTADDVSKECESLAVQIKQVEDFYNRQLRVVKRNKWKHKGWK